MLQIQIQTEPSVHAPAVFLHVSPKLTDADQTEQYQQKMWGLCCCFYPLALVRHKEEITLEELLKKNASITINNTMFYNVFFYRRGTLAISPSLLLS